MNINIDCVPGPRGVRMYSPEFEPLLQMLLSTLADIDFAYESDLEIVRNSSVDETLKQTVIERLEQLHRQQREPHLRELASLQTRMSAVLE
jgi:hypothetical protein